MNRQCHSITVDIMYNLIHNRLGNLKSVELQNGKRQKPFDYLNFWSRFM